MDLQNDNCRLNVSEADIKNIALIPGVSGIVCILFSIVGLAVEIVFVCKKKNTFLLRLIVYLSFSAAAVVGCLASHILVYFRPKNESLCQILDTILRYFISVELSFVFSINLVLLYKMCGSFRYNYHGNSLINKINKLDKKCWLEVFLVILNFGIPAIAFLVYFEALRSPGTCSYTHRLDCYSNYFKYWVFDSEIPLVMLDGLLVLLCLCVFIVWLCWLRSRLFWKARMKTVMKEIGVWLGLFVVYFVMAILFEVTAVRVVSVDSWFFALFPLLQLGIFVVFFGYMCVSLCSCCKLKTYVDHRAKELEIEIQTDLFETTLPSTRVSLPSDVDAHAPDFQSPKGEVSSELSHLLR